MPYRYIEHTADAAIEATGRNLEEAFAETARAMFSLMVREMGISPGIGVGIRVQASSLEDLLVEFLNDLLARQGLEDILFVDCEVENISRSESGSWILSGAARGVPLESVKNSLGVEVKAASYLGLHVEETGEGYRVRCVVDV